MRPESWVDSSRSWRAREPRLSSRTTLSPRGRSGQSEERDICEFSSSGWINDVVEEGESRLGGGPQLARVGGGLP